MAIADKAKKQIFMVCKYVILCGMVFIVLYPMLGVFFASFKTQAEYLSTPSMKTPENCRISAIFILYLLPGMWLRDS